MQRGLRELFLQYTFSFFLDALVSLLEVIFGSRISLNVEPEKCQVNFYNTCGDWRTWTCISSNFLMIFFLKSSFLVFENYIYINDTAQTQFFAMNVVD